MLMDSHVPGRLQPKHAEGAANRLEHIRDPERHKEGHNILDASNNALLRCFATKLHFVYTYTGIVDAPYPR